MNELSRIRDAVIEFRDARDWKKFHSLKNLLISLNLEASELLELAQWQQDIELDQFASTSEGKEALRDECADVLLYLILIADLCDIDLYSAAMNKLEKNAQKYPVEKSLGKSTKYTKL